MGMERYSKLISSSDLIETLAREIAAEATRYRYAPTVTEPVGEEALGDTHIGEEGTNESACAETVQPTESERNAKGSNVERSVRGTIAFICHRSGTSIKPQYNRCGILTALEFQDGSRFVRSSGPKPWMVLDADGEEQSQPKVASVSMGRRGTISFVCENGEKTVLCTSGAKIVLQQ